MATITERCDPMTPGVALLPQSTLPFVHHYESNRAQSPQREVDELES